MAVFTSDQPAKTIEEEAPSDAKVNQDDPNLETSKIPLDFSSCSDLAFADWYLCSRIYESGNEEEDGEGVNLISDWVVSDESRSSTSDEEFPVTIASLPVGTVLSVKDKQVIVEGKGKHNLLSIGSFLWITETRDPLGYVDEVFGTVEQPCFSVSLKSESQVPEGIRQGTQVSLIVVDSLRREKIASDAMLSSDEKESECEDMQKKVMSSERKADNVGDDIKVLDLESSEFLDAEQALPSDSQTNPVTPQAVPETDGGSVPQSQPLPFKFTAPGTPETNKPKPYQPPMAKKKSAAAFQGFTPSPVPTQTPEWMTPPRYPQQHYRNGQNHINQQPSGLHQRYQSGAFPCYQPGYYYIPPPTQPPQFQRGRRSNHRGGGTGFLGRGRELPQPK